MRNRLGAAITAGLVLLAGLTGVALAAIETVADDFSSGGYGGSTGTMEWAGSWVEVGESNGSGSGAVQVQTDAKCASGQCLTIDQILGGLSSIGAMRSLDLSEATSASLTYHIDFPGGLLLDGTAVVEARASGAGWSQLGSHNAGTADTFTADLPVGHIVDVRFRAADLALTASMGFDDVSVEVDLSDTSTTTSPTSSSSTTAFPITTIISPPTVPTISPPTIPTIDPTTPTIAPPATPTTTEQGDDPPASAAPPVGGPTTTIDRDRPPADPDTTTTSGEDGDATTAPATTIPGTTTPEPENASGSGGESDAVVTDLDPRFRSEGVGGLGAQENLLVVFGRAVEDIALDLLASAVLGLVLAWASVRRLG